MKNAKARKTGYCSLCYKTKKMEFLIRNSRRFNKDGTVTEYFHCQKCSAKRIRGYTQTRRWKINRKKYVKTYLINNRIKVNARALLNDHKRRGKILVPNSCRITILLALNKRASLKHSEHLGSWVLCNWCSRKLSIVVSILFILV